MSLNTAVCESSSATVTALPTLVASPFHESDRRCRRAALSALVTGIVPAGDEQDVAATAAKIARRVAGPRI